MTRVITLARKAKGPARLLLVLGCMLLIILLLLLLLVLTMCTRLRMVLVVLEHHVIFTFNIRVFNIRVVV